MAARVYDDYANVGFKDGKGVTPDHSADSSFQVRGDFIFSSVLSGDFAYTTRV